MGMPMMYAQENLNFKNVESKTLSYYYASNWDSLIFLGEKAEKSGIDYYYLNYRIGLAYYYTSDFFTASYYFNKAYKQNKTATLDSFFKEKYFFSLLYSRQNVAANKLLDVADSLETKSDINFKGNIFLYGLFGNAVTLIGPNKMRSHEHSVLSQTNYVNSISLAGISYSGIVGENVELDLNYNYANLQMVAAVENPFVFQVRNFNIHQNALNIKPKFWLNRTNSIAVAGGFSTVSGKTFGVVDSTNMDFGYINYSSKSFMGGLQFEHINKTTIWGLSGVVSNFGQNDIQMQAGASFTWFPKGNIDFYSLTQANVLKDGNSSLRPILYQKFGFKINPNIWFEAAGIYGDVKNFTLLSNNYSYEIPNHTHALLSGKLIYVLNKNINLFLGTQYLWKYTEQKEIDYSSVYDLKTIDYQQLNISGGLQWKF